MSSITTHVFDSFDESSLHPECWARLLDNGETNAVNLTWQWQRSWWKAFGRGRLLLIVAVQDGQTQAIAPFFTEGGMVFNLCPEDHLGFVGNVADPEVLDALLNTARAQVPDFVGYRFFFIPDTSSTGGHLQAAAARLGLTCIDEGALPCPYLDIAGKPEAARNCTRKKSLRRHERYFRREGNLVVQHCREPEAILPHLDGFFQQHIERRATTPYPSQFEDQEQRTYYRNLTQDVGPTGWLRFTVLQWDQRPIAYHFGLCYLGRYLYGIPSFDVELARHSPGEVLLRQLLLAAIDEGADSFDFGIGDEDYKYRFATDDVQLRTWGLYTADSMQRDGAS